MLTGNTTVESSSGEVQITDVSFEGMELGMELLKVDGTALEIHVI